MTGRKYAVQITKSAERDLVALHAYLVREGVADAADRLLDRLTEAAASLERFPERGPASSDAEALGRKDVRHLVVAPDLLFYRLRGREVFVFLIAHGRRDMRALLERRLLRE